jgi:apolipoprotein N-acyltransferase
VSLSEPRTGVLFPTLDEAARFMAGLRGWRRAAAGFTLGAVSVAGFAPFHLWPLLFVTLPAFIWMLDGIAAPEPAETARWKTQWRRAAVAGWWFGFGYFFAGLYWLGFAFFVEADKFAILAPLGVAAFPAALAIFPALATSIAILLWRPGVSRIFAFTITFFAADWLRGHILTGFPWNLWGYALAGNDALAQSASLFGIYGLTLLTLLIAASPAALAGSRARERSRGWLLPVLCVILLGAGWSWGAVRLGGATAETVEGVRLRIVQGNIPQADKWKPEHREWIFDRLLTLSRTAAGSDAEPESPTHIIWPETAVPVLFMLNESIHSEDVRSALARLIAPGATMILGAERVEGTKRDDGRYNIDRVYNSLFMLGAQARPAGIYDKVHLVPFGEYLPFEETLTALGVTQLTHVNTGFASGDSKPLMTAGNAPPFMPLICYEAIFPGWVAGSEGGRPAWLLNLTNDAWFGTSTGPYQHLHQTRLRAIEEGLPLIRSANTGISAVIDPYGRIARKIPLNEMGVIDYGLPVAISPTPYTLLRQKWLILFVCGFFILYRLAIKVE